MGAGILLPYGLIWRLSETIGPRGTVSRPWGQAVASGIDPESAFPVGKWGPGGRFTSLKDLCYQAVLQEHQSSAAPGMATETLHKGLSRKMQPCLDSFNAFSLKRRFPRPFFPPKTAFPSPDKTKLHQNCCELSARCLPCLGHAASCRPSKPTPPVRAEFPLLGHDQPLALPQTPCSVADPPSSWSQPRCRLHPTAPAEAAELRKQKQNKKKSNATPKQRRKPGGSQRNNPAWISPPPASDLLPDGLQSQHCRLLQ